MKPLEIAAVGMLVVGVLSQSAAGQQHRGMRGMGEGGAGMGPAFQAFSPTLLLDAQTELRLSQAQIENLGELQDELDRRIAAVDSAHAEHRARLHELTVAPTSDTEEISQHFWAAHTAMGNRHWAQLEISLRARGLLTEEQREEVERTSRPGGQGPPWR